MKGRPLSLSAFNEDADLFENKSVKLGFFDLNRLFSPAGVDPNLGEVCADDGSDP